MKIEIRKACINDAEAICQISSNDLGYPCSPEQIEAKLRKLDHSREEVFVAVTGENHVAGYIHVQKYDVLYAETLANILGLAVRSELRKNGIGRLLVEEMERWAIGCGIHRIRLNSGISRKGAHEFYRNLGYGEEKEQIRFIKKV